MDDISLGTLVLLVLATPLLAITAFIMAIRHRKQMRRLDARVQHLTAEVARLRAEPPSSAPQAVASSVPAEEPKEEIATAPEIVSPPVRPADPPKRKSGLEEAVGARAAVWVGGLALILGGVFLVRYSIEQGLFGPGARVAAGVIFALCLLAVGEWLRRNERASAIPGVPAAHIPGVLTAAGTTTAFATVYAAYALYGFLTPALAFLVLAMVSLGTMLAAALHGPVLAALGLVAATALPALVSSDAPSAWGLFAHLSFVSASAFGVARLRGWAWLMTAASSASFGWGVAYVAGAGSAASASPLSAFIAVFFALVGVYHASAPLRDEAAGRPDWPSTAVAAAFGLLIATVAIVDDHRSASLVLVVLLFVAEIALAAWRRRLAVLFPTAALTACLTILAFDLAPWLLAEGTTAFPLPGETAPLPSRVGSLLSLSIVLGGMIGSAGLLLAWRQPDHPLWITGARTGGAVAAALGALAVTYWKIATLAPDLRFGLAALALAGGLAFLTDRFARRERVHSMLVAATAAVATGTVAAIGLGFATVLREGFLTISLSILALGIAWVHGSRRIAALPVLAMIIGAVVLLRTGLDPLLIGQGTGSTSFLNNILWIYGLPAAAFAATAWLFGRQSKTRATGLFEGLALLYVALLFALQIRHLSTGGDLQSASASLSEIGLQVMTGCLISLAAQRLALSRPGSVLRIGSMALGAVSLAAGLLGLLLVVNPMFTRESIGSGLIFNDLIPGYLLPALAAAALCLHSRGRRPRWYVLASGILAGLLVFTLVSLEVRAAYHRPILSAGDFSAGESYAYSVVWLLYGLLVLIAGALTGSRDLRLGSAAVILLTVLKVFLLDMNGLEGVLRALSFMGLGLALVGIGLLYQRLLFPRHAAPSG